jgi:hypothetical protein
MCTVPVSVETVTVNNVAQVDGPDVYTVKKVSGYGRNDIDGPERACTRRQKTRTLTVCRSVWQIVPTRHLGSGARNSPYPWPTSDVPAYTTISPDSPQTSPLSGVTAGDVMLHPFRVSAPLVPRCSARHLDITNAVFQDISYAGLVRYKI